MGAGAVSETFPPEGLRTVPELIKKRADELGKLPLLNFEDQTYAYDEINRKANRMANALSDLGIKKGDSVTVFLQNSPEYLSLWFAIAKIGAIMVPVNVENRGETLEHILQDNDSNTVILDDSTRNNYETVQDEYRDDYTELILGETRSARYQRFDEMFPKYDDEPIETSVAPGDPMGIIYTSGSTGQPKGVILPHYSYVNTGWEFARNILSLDDDDRLFTTLPLFHCNAQQTTVMGAMVAGTDFVLEAGFSPETFWERIREQGVTVFNYIGSMIPLLYKLDERPDDYENPAQYGIGAAASVEIIEDFEDRFNVTLIEGYGLTETATVATVNHPNQRRIGSVGKALTYTKIDIVDSDDYSLPPGETGEIVVRPTEPNTMMSGYYGRPAETVDVWQNLWYHTGDLGYKDEDGYVYFVDRKEYAIDKQGQTISSFEIERVITEYPGIKEISVFGVPNEHGNQDIKVVAVPRQGFNVDPIDIVTHCEEYLPYFKLPRYVELVDELPKTPTERVKKYKLKQRDHSSAWDRENGYELFQ